MKKLFQPLAGAGLIALLLNVSLSSCTQDTDGSPQIGPGNLTVSEIRPDSAAGGTLLTVMGSGMGAIRSIVFEKDNVPAGFYSTLNTDDAILFRVPEEAIGGEQKIIFTNSAGKTASTTFRVLAYPSVASASNYNFTKGTRITLTGNNFDDVTAVTLTGTSDAATIVSQTKKELVLEFPATTVNRATLDIVNGTGKITTTQEFVAIDNALKIFGDAYGPGFGDGSWGDAALISKTEFKSGTASIGKNYQKGNWHLIGFSNWSPSVPYSAQYQYLTVWIKGASEDYSLYITTDASAGGFGNYIEANKLNVKAGVWNYFKVKLSDIDFWSSGKTLAQLGFRIQGPDKQDEVFYFDDLMLVK
ncbi:hypothetical protein GCM10027275_41510 [Rhabdobacter roseus]|uniref:IPT/TIG domain-containing protein n=1 Tax=Rhabdobacter roseus TaxID=1655419 RepID=A0A840TX15_9BACT|nr:IPT/TIG domain-containing protein [Rhabdobacter roseus]MBB5286127.1 hypothetical protein [Rhabdobacter roseus]